MPQFNPNLNPGLLRGPNLNLTDPLWSTPYPDDVFRLNPNPRNPRHLFNPIWS